MTDDLVPMGVRDDAVRWRTIPDPVSSVEGTLLSEFITRMSRGPNDRALDALVDGLRESKVKDYQANAAVLRACSGSDEAYLHRIAGKFLWIAYCIQPAPVVTYDLPFSLDVMIGDYRGSEASSFFKLAGYRYTLPKVVVNHSESFPSFRSLAVVNHGRCCLRSACLTVDFAEKDPPQVTLFSAYIAANTRSIMLPGGNWRAPILLHWVDDDAGSSLLRLSRLRDDAPHLRNTSKQEFPKEGAFALRDHIDGIIRAAAENPGEILTTYSTPDRPPVEYLNYRIGELLPSVWEGLPAVPL